MDYLQILFTSFLSSILGGGLIYKLLETGLTEKIKNGIKLHYDLQFENAKKDLEKKATEFQIQYSKLHIDRSEKLKEVYIKLIEEEEDLKNLVSVGQGPNWADDSKIEEMRNSIKDLELCILKSRIYFGADLCERLDKTIIDYKDVVGQMYLAKQNSNMEKKGIRTNEFSLDLWQKQRDRVNQEIKETRLTIENEFRSLLGVEDLKV